MPKFRKKPVVIEAEQWFKMGDVQCVTEYSPMTKVKVRHCTHCGQFWHMHGWVVTFEGGHVACPGDWIITGVQGEKYPCKPDIFEETYERVEE